MKQAIITKISASALLVLLQGVFAVGQAQTVMVPCPAVPTGNCIDDVVSRNQCPNNCTANDVSIALLLNKTNTACELGKNFDVNLVAELKATSEERWDIGMFIALDGGEARTGKCYRDYLAPPLALAGSYVPGTVTTHIDPATEMIILDSFSPGSPFYNGEPKDNQDTCGDLEQGIINVYQIPQTLTIPCIDRNNNGIADISSCVSWDNTKNNTCTNVDGTIPNTKAKCRCETLDIANVPIKASLTLVKKVVNDNGGTTLASAWTLTAAGDGGFSGQGTCADASCLTASISPTSIKPNVEYTLSESPNPGKGYSTTGIWVCDGGTFTAPNKIKLIKSGNVNCTHDHQR